MSWDDAYSTAFPVRACGLGHRVRFDLLRENQIDRLRIVLITYSHGRSSCGKLQNLHRILVV